MQSSENKFSSGRAQIGDSDEKNLFGFRQLNESYGDKTAGRNLSKMKGVDKKRFRDGIDMNPETQLVTIALKENGKVDYKDLMERVEDAGYDAIEEYKLHDGHLDAHRFKKDASVDVVHHESRK